MFTPPDAILKVALEAHFVEVAGVVYTGVEFSYDSWREYLDVFERVEPIARVAQADRIPDGWTRADGPGVEFHRVYDYRGFWQFLRRFGRVFLDCRRAVREQGPILLRTGLISNLCRISMKVKRQPYAIELLGHAGDSIAMVRNVRVLGLSRALAAISHRIARRLALGAYCANYISGYLQTAYPTRHADREWVVSDVRLPPEAFGQQRQADSFRRNPMRVVSVGRLEPEKGHSFLLTAIALLKSRGLIVRCELVGAGREMESLKRQAVSLGIHDAVVFHGQVSPGRSLMQLLMEAELFVLPSLTEGLGRALLEAMALGLPAIGSDTGGIVELLDPETRVTPGDAEALADAIQRIVQDPDGMARMSARNIAVAQNYRLEELQRRRRDFWKAIRTTWLARCGVCP